MQSRINNMVVERNVSQEKLAGYVVRNTLRGKYAIELKRLQNNKQQNVVFHCTDENQFKNCLNCVSRFEKVYNVKFIVLKNTESISVAVVKSAT